jgi:hypothetical protein
MNKWSILKIWRIESINLKVIGGCHLMELAQVLGVELESSL